jgi:50S ribosomal protein L16 3-hydroxylase
LARFQFDEQHFLTHYWQRKPLLIKRALARFKNPLAPQELAGLAMESDVASRIVSEHDGIWQLDHGPFQAQDFQREGPWTLLVDQVDCMVPEVEALREAVNFLPTWRYDDVMVSYASDGGSVGPHFDRYDVFLVQGMGQRMWRLGDVCDADTPRLEHDSLNLLKAFTTHQEYLLEPGDVLYVPPGLAHWGIAVGECMTYSIGFRAPPIAHLLARMTDHVLEALDPLLLLEDRPNDTVGRPGEVTQDHIRTARQALESTLAALDDGRWFADALADVDDGPCVESSSALLQLPVRLIPGVRMVWITRPVWLDVFVQGYQFQVVHALTGVISMLCRGDTILLEDVDVPTELTLEASESVFAEPLTLLNYLNELGLLINPD